MSWSINSRLKMSSLKQICVGEHKSRGCLMQWSIEKISIKELKSYEKNPRILTDKERRSLSDSIDKFGLVDKPIVNCDYTIIGGHQRIQVLLSRDETEVECWFPDAPLSNTEVEELNVRLNRNNGDWDYDILANEFDVGDLLTWGFDEDDLGLGKPDKPEKEPKATISLEFNNKDVMMNYIQQCEAIAEDASAKIKVRG